MTSARQYCHVVAVPYHRRNISFVCALELLLLLLLLLVVLVLLVLVLLLLLAMVPRHFFEARWRLLPEHVAGALGAANALLLARAVGNLRVLSLSERPTNQ
jgi:hypothetical protein